MITRLFRKNRFPFSFNPGKIKSFLKEYFLSVKDIREAALSISAGVFVGLFIPPGFQTILVFPIAYLLRCNLPAAYAGTFITNPFTMIPIYYSFIKLGEIILRTKVNWNEAINAIMAVDFAALSGPGKEILLVYFTGGLVISLIITVFTYFIVLKAGPLIKAKSLRKRQTKEEVLNEG